MICSKCQTPNPVGNISCVTCNTLLAEGGETVVTTNETVVVGAATEWSAGAVVPPAEATLSPGSVLGDRYEILELLGEGGMGAVYKARDREVDRLVALKIIRPDLAGSPEILRRFKQELILARKITHKNVIRIFDLGVADGLRFISMEYIDGPDLATVLEKRGKFSPLEAAGIIEQVCEGLAVAHAEQVIHRDLKPRNLMMDATGKVSIMDFGIAGTSFQPVSAGEGAGAVPSGGPSHLTQVGGLLGTPTYMSPEQARGGKIDARSDLFALGIIFYELLTGAVPYEADTAVETMRKRIEEAPVPPVELDPTIPKQANAIILRCLRADPQERYQSAAEVLRDLELWLRPPKRMTAIHWIASGLAAVLLATGGLVYWQKSSATGHAKKPVTVLVADFRNATSDPVFEGTLEPVLNVALEGASFITAYKRTQAHRIAGQLKPGATQLDESLARLVAVREGVNVIVTGSIVREGDRYGITVKAIDSATGKPIVTRDARSLRKNAVLSSVGSLAAPIRRALGDATPESAQLAAAETFTTSSLDAAHAYSQAQDFLDQGKSGEAIQYYEKAVQLDQKLGRAYAGLAVASLNLKRRTEADGYYKKSLALLDRMSERERYRTLGTYYAAFLRNYPQAIDSYRKLVAAYPGDGSAWNNLSISYGFTLNIPEAMAASRRALEINPRSPQYRLSFATYAMFAADFDTAIAEAKRVLKENPSYEFAYLPLALSTLARGDTKGAREIYTRFAKVSPEGYSMAKLGEADLEMYLGRYREALEPLGAGIAYDIKEGRTGELAFKYVTEAEIQLALGRKALAVKLADKAAQLFRVESVLLPAARVLAEAGQDAKAMAIAAALENMLQPQTRSYAKLITGEILLHRNKLPEAVTAFQEGQKLHNSWLSRFLLGQAYLEAGHLAEALGEFETCRQRRGESTDLFFADTTTLRYLPTLYYWLALAQQGVGMTEAARNNLQEFLKLRQEADLGAPLVSDAKRRLASKE